MKTRNLRLIKNAFIAAALALAAPAGFGAFDPVNDDTDIFLADPAFNAERPNVLIIMDNSNGKASDNTNDLDTSLAGLTTANGGVAPSQITLSNVSPDSSSQQGN